MGVYELSGAGSLKTGRVLYPTMNANNGNNYGAMVPLGSLTATSAYGRYFSFTSIPQTYQDLRIVCSVRTDHAATTDLFGMFFNFGEGGTINSQTSLNGDGASVTQLREQNLFTMIRTSVAANTATSGIFSTVTIDILNYSSTSLFKTALARTATELNGSGNTTLTASLARLTSAVSIVSVGAIGSGTNLIAGSTATLYGIRAVSS